MPAARLRTRCRWLAVPLLVVALAACGADRDPEAAREAYARAIAISRTGDLAGAREALERAVALDPDLVEARLVLGAVLERSGDLDGAEAQYRAAERLAPASEARLHLARVQRFRELDARRADLAQQLARAPADVAVHAALTQLLIERGAFDEAQRQSVRWLRLAPEDPEAHAAYALTLSQQNRLPRALYHLSQALERAPAHPIARAELAWILATARDATLRDLDRAATIVHDATTDREQQTPRMLEAAAAVAAAGGRFEDAVELARTAATLAEQRGAYALAASIRTRLPVFASGRAYLSPATHEP